MADYPQYYHYFSASAFQYDGRPYRSHNRLLKSYEGTDGIKTGYTRASDFNLVSSVQRAGRHLIAAVLCGQTSRPRHQHKVKLLDPRFNTLASMGGTTLPPPPPRHPT